MKTISKEYIVLFNEMTDAYEKLNDLSNELGKISRRLMYAQMHTEDLFLEDDSTDMLHQTED